MILPYMKADLQRFASSGAVCSHAALKSLKSNGLFGILHSLQDLLEGCGPDIGLRAEATVASPVMERILGDAE